MITNEFTEASAELNEILTYLPTEMVDRIPLKVRNYFKKNAMLANNYKSKINSKDPLNEQNLNEKKKDLITILYRDYWCSEEEKKELDQKLLQNDKLYEEEFRKKYNYDDIFKKNDNIPRAEEKIRNELIPIKKESIFTKIVNKIKSIISKYK